MRNSRKLTSCSQNSKIGNRSKTGPQRQFGLIARKISLEVPIQLLIFRYHDNTGSIDVLLLRVEFQYAGHFAGAFCICRKFSGIVTGAKIRLCAIVLDVGQRDADSRSILPRYALKS